MPKWLVILDNPAGRPALEAAGKVLQSSGDRVAVIDASDADAIRALPGVRSVTEGAPDAATLADLDEGSRLFAEAWREQRKMATKQRPGEGLDWDTPGFEAPG